MSVLAGVSSGVSCRVSRGGSSKPIESSVSRRGAGPYLVRSGTIYLFQIRLPKDLGGGRSKPPIRISLGAGTVREARRKADLLAAHARRGFEELRERRLIEDEDSDGRRVKDRTPTFSGETPEEALVEV